MSTEERFRALADRMADAMRKALIDADVDDAFGSAWDPILADYDDAVADR